MESKPQIPLKLDIQYEEKEELDNFAMDENFHRLITENTFAALKQAIRKNKSECILFDVINFDLKVKVKKANYKKLLDQLLKYYEGIEDYTTCSELIKLKARL